LSLFGVTNGSAQCRCTQPTASVKAGVKVVQCGGVKVSQWS